VFSSVVRFLSQPFSLLSLLAPAGAEPSPPKSQLVSTGRDRSLRAGDVKNLSVCPDETVPAFRLSAIWAEKQEEFRAFIRLKALNNPCL
jgi:hypothetical protein